jgi:hypothetical protein
MWSLLLRADPQIRISDKGVQFQFMIFDFYWSKSQMDAYACTLDTTVSLQNKESKFSKHRTTEWFTAAILIEYSQS